MNAQKPVTIYEHADELNSLQGVVDLVKLSDQYRQSAILHSALAQRVFDHTRQPVSAQALSDALGWVPNKGRIFLNALVAMGLLKRTAQGFENLPLSQRFLVSDSAEFIGVPGEDGAWIPGYVDGFSGWVSSEFLKEPPPLPQIAVEDWNLNVWQGATLSATNVRAQPNTQSPVLEVLPAGSFVEVTDWVAGEAVLDGVSQWSRLDSGGYVFTRNIGRNAPVLPPDSTVPEAQMICWPQDFVQRHPLWIGSIQGTFSGFSTGSMSRFTTTASLSERTSTHSSVSSVEALIS